MSNNYVAFIRRSQPYVLHISTSPRILVANEGLLPILILSHSCKSEIHSPNYNISQIGKAFLHDQSDYRACSYLFGLESVKTVTYSSFNLWD